MFKVLFVFFVVVPIVEIAVLMQVGQFLGVWPTVSLVIITAWLGAKNVKQQGLATIQSLQQKMASGGMPSDEIVAGLLLLVAGIFLVTPGFVTDILGLSLLVPSVRRLLIATVQQQLVNNAAKSHSFSFHQQTFNQQTFRQSPFQQEKSEHLHSEHIHNDDEISFSKNKHQGHTLDGEYERKD